MLLKLDLHNHSCLSPCAQNELTPGTLAVTAMEMGIDFLALTDHNCARNLPAFKEVCEICGLVGIYGIEVNTIEEVHVLSLFERLEDAMEFGLFVEALLPPIKNDPRLFGDQLIVDEADSILATFDKNILSSCGISFSDLVEETLSRDGLCIPAHVDRPAFSVFSSLGFLPDEPYSAVEVTEFPTRLELGHNAVITGSDAHFIKDIGKRAFALQCPSRDFEGLKRGLLDLRP
ncbi:MAG: PHP domain-containing protein [Sphaerochaetaceae bacterium]|jgi:PHP family Zn ribbon phosphoesterase|nr:PHP domain-containing protein [Sphaerochaetaceae bacterium]